MIVNILDYKGTKTGVDIDLETVQTITIDVVSGDEVMVVVNKDDTVNCFDSSHDRQINYYDGTYKVYDAATGVNLLNDEKFMNRKDSYDYLWNW